MEFSRQCHQYTLEELNNFFKKSYATRQLLYENLWNEKEIDDVWKLDSFSKFKQCEDEYEKYIITPYEVSEGVLQCNKCKSTKIFSYSSQVRSGDEPMSVFAMCSNCQHKWIQ